MAAESGFDTLTQLQAICSLDGRYRKNVEELSPYASEYGLMRERVEVEATHVVKLCDVGSNLGRPIGRTLEPQERQFLLGLGPNLSLEQAAEIKTVEDRTNHDVNAMIAVFRTLVQGTSMEDLTELIHWPLTSEDINNLAYRLLAVKGRDRVIVPALDRLTDDLVSIADSHKASPMLGRTHGQSAMGTTFGKEMVVFADRLNDETRELEQTQLTGKFNGAMGNYNAHQVAASDLDWVAYSKDFISGFGFKPQLITTQINRYEDLIKMFQNYQRINGVVVDFAQDSWRYISDEWLVQVVKSQEVGSSTMTQKVNPIYFERAEGNAEIATSILEGMSRKLARSRLQRDLSDSTTIRNMGIGFGFSLLSYINAREGLSRVRPNTELMRDRLAEEWSTLGEAAQVVMRRAGVADPYEVMKQATRGKKLDQTQWQNLVAELEITDSDRKELLALSPESYIGLAENLTEIALEKIRASKNVKAEYQPV